MEIATIKLFIKEHLNNNKNGIQNNEAEIPEENSPLIEHLQRTIYKLEQENNSKATIIKF